MYFSERLLYNWSVPSSEVGVGSISIGLSYDVRADCNGFGFESTIFFISCIEIQLRRLDDSSAGLDLDNCDVFMSWPLSLAALMCLIESNADFDYWLGWLTNSCGSKFYVFSNYCLFCEESDLF